DLLRVRPARQGAHTPDEKTRNRDHHRVSSAVDAAYVNDGRLYLTCGAEFVRYTLSTPGRCSCLMPAGGTLALLVSECPVCRQSP
ncbi:MAG: hypothetical protein ACRDTJ_13460, partial [Pseudonocardiaceae bacterium]